MKVVKVDDVGDERVGLLDAEEIRVLRVPEDSFATLRKVFEFYELFLVGLEEVDGSFFFFSGGWGREKRLE